MVTAMCTYFIFPVKEVGMNQTLADEKFGQNVPLIHDHFSGHHDVLISNQSCIF